MRSFTVPGGGAGGGIIGHEGFSSVRRAKNKRRSLENSPVCYASFFVGSLRLSYDDLRPVGFFVGFHFRFGFLGIRLFVDDAEYFSTSVEQ